MVVPFWLGPQTMPFTKELILLKIWMSPVGLSIQQKSGLSGTLSKHAQP